MQYDGPFDHKDLLLDLKDNQRWGKGFWKLNTSLLVLPQTTREIENVIQNHEKDKQKYDPLIWWDILKEKIKRKFIEIGINNQNEKRKQQHELEEQLEKTQYNTYKPTRNTKIRQRIERT